MGLVAHVSGETRLPDLSKTRLHDMSPNASRHVKNVATCVFKTYCKVNTFQGKHLKPHYKYDTLF